MAIMVRSMCLFWATFWSEWFDPRPDRLALYGEVVQVDFVKRRRIRGHGLANRETVAEHIRR